MKQRRPSSERQRERQRRNAAIHAGIAAGALGALALLARRATRPTPTRVDRWARAMAMRHRRVLVSALLAPLDPLGYPVGYIPLAHLCARWLRHRGVREHRALVVGAWSAWIAHRLVKLVYERERPPRGVRLKGPKRDSFPSGHTTGATAFSIVLARVLRDNDMLSPAQAIAMAALVSFVVGGSRVHADVHWATDVAGGWLLGGAVAFCIGALVDARALAVPPRGAVPR